MNHPLQTVTEKRQHLIAQIASQRMLFAQNADSLRKPLAMADKGLNVLRYIKHHPILIAGGSAALLSIARPSRIWKWYRRGWLVWEILSNFRKK